LGADVSYHAADKEPLYGGDEFPLLPVDTIPPTDIMLAEIGKDVTKKTLLIYGHVDVCSTDDGESWNSDPFTMSIRDGDLVGRGTIDAKGPILGWYNVVETLCVRNYFL
ncbi:unnamed protein product, partial [Protopolystoma xenopodis]